VAVPRSWDIIHVRENAGAAGWNLGKSDVERLERIGLRGLYRIVLYGSIYNFFLKGESIYNFFFDLSQ
jgi:diketogulonate reductase-like aldo/keto reductase